MPRFLHVADHYLGADHQVSFADGTWVGQTKFLGWPVDAYRLSVPVAQDKELPKGSYVFEYLIASLLVADNPAIHAEKYLAEQTCLPEDFVHAIVLKLQQNGKIQGNRLSLTSSAREEITKSHDSQFNLLYETVTGFVFRDAVTGKMLPNIMLFDENEKDRGKGSAHLGPQIMEDEEIHKKAPYLLQRAQEGFPAPERREVQGVIREYLSLARDSGIQQRRRLSENASFSTIKTAEPFYLLCPIGIRKSDAELRIADPFGIGYALVLEAALEEQRKVDPDLQKTLSGWQRQWERDDNQEKEENQEQNYPFDSSLLRKKYPQLYERLRSAYRQQDIPDLYAGLEWALFYHLRTTDDLNAIVLAIQGLEESEFQEKTQTILQKYGWHQDLKNQSRRPPEGKLRYFSCGREPNFTVLFPIMLFRDDPALAQIYQHFGSDFTKSFKALRISRGHDSHGDVSHPSQDMSFEEACKIAEPLIHIVLPDVSFQASRELKIAQESKMDRKLKAQNDVEQQYGYSVYSSLPQVVQDHLVEIRSEWNSICSSDSIPSTRFVREVSAAMQAYLDVVLKNTVPPEGKGDLFEKATQRIQKIGFVPLPDGYKRLNPQRLVRAMRKESASLGISGFMLALCGHKKDLRKVCSQFPDFFDFIMTVHEQRGHGGSTMTLSKAALDSWNQSLERFIITLSEVHHGKE